LMTSPLPTAKNGFMIVLTQASYTSTIKFLTASSVAGLLGLYRPAPPPNAALPPARLPLAPPAPPLVSPRLSSRGRVSRRKRVLPPVIQHDTKQFWYLSMCLRYMGAEPLDVEGPHCTSSTMSSEECKMNGTSARSAGV
jgi:hypothetical protein